jgi:Protein of unknown function (DUF3300)
MIMKHTRQVLAVGLSLLIAASSYGYQNTESTPGNGAGGATDAAPMSTTQLDALVAPIALYPDALVAQILAAATFPDQVAIADYWIHEQHVTGTALMQAVNKQSWDASVKALTQFPSVLDNLAKNLTWTSSLGEAYHNQASELMAAVQTLRAQAKAAGNLKSTPQVTVAQQTPQTIVIQPANPQVVYVPEYNPAAIYGYPYVTPGYTAGDVAAAGIIGFGAGIALGAFAGGGCCGWGWNSWGCNWGGGAVVYNHNNFYGNSAWHGGYNTYNRAAVNNFHGSANRVTNANREDDRNLNANHADSWDHDDSALGRSNAFSGLGDRFGSSGGWASRANSFRGWGSMRAGGFAGGRFGGGGFGGFHGFGGGGFRGGGFRR